MKITEHFDSDEFVCTDGTPYPPEWYDTRLLPLCETLEVIRAAVGGVPLHIDSGFRTLAYDQKLFDASPKDGSVAPPTSSQHPQGRAADVVSIAMRPVSLFNLVLQLYEQGKLPYLGGVGLYPNFVHVDIAPRAGSTGGASDGHLRIWGGTRPSNIA